jgi:hypothetical protein
MNKNLNFECSFCKYFKRLYYQKYGGYKFCGYGICIKQMRRDYFTEREKCCGAFRYSVPEYNNKDFKAYCALREIKIKFNNIQRFYDKHNQNNILKKIIANIEKAEKDV